MHHASGGRRTHRARSGTPRWIFDARALSLRSARRRRHRQVAIEHDLVAVLDSLRDLHRRAPLCIVVVTKNCEHIWHLVTARASMLADASRDHAGRTVLLEKGPAGHAYRRGPWKYAPRSPLRSAAEGRFHRDLRPCRTAIAWPREHVLGARVHEHVPASSSPPALPATGAGAHDRRRRPPSRAWTPDPARARSTRRAPEYRRRRRTIASPRRCRRRRARPRGPGTGGT